MLVVTDIRVPLGTEEQALSKQIANQLKIDADRIQSVRLLRKSLDARKKQDIHYLIHAVIAVDDALEKKLLLGGSSHISAYRPAVEQPVSSGTLEPKGRIIVVGLGPACSQRMFWQSTAISRWSLSAGSRFNSGYPMWMRSGAKARCRRKAT